MAELKVLYDQSGNTLTVWFGSPHDEHTCEETGDEIILMKDKSGHVIRFEKLNYSANGTENVRVSFEQLPAESA